MRAETAASWGGEIRFGFVANSGDGNEMGIAEKICVGYKGEIQLLLLNLILNNCKIFF